MTSKSFNQDLWRKLAAFQLDEPGVAYPFSKRLARENNWDCRYALRVIEEYKRFLYLAVAADHSVTPSADIDAAWHLHLLYTRSYWLALCPNVLGRSLHHNPTQGGAGQSDLFRDQYARTLESYERAFGAAPPADIWLSPAIQFPAVRRGSILTAKRRLNLSKMRIPASIAAVGVGLVAGGCSAQVLSSSRISEGSLVIIVAIVIGLVVIAGFISSIIRPRPGDSEKVKKDHWNGCSAGCSSGSDSGGDAGGDAGCGSGCGGD